MVNIIFKNKRNPVFCDVLVNPVFTAKSLNRQVDAVYSFEVLPWADKAIIKAAVENIFDVKVVAVNTLNVRGKTKKFKGRFGQRSDSKKAIVKLAPGHKIAMLVSEEVNDENN